MLGDRGEFGEGDYNKEELLFGIALDGLDASEHDDAQGKRRHFTVRCVVTS